MFMPSGVNHNVLICDWVLADTSKIVSYGMVNAFFVAVVLEPQIKTLWARIFI